MDNAFTCQTCGQDFTVPEAALKKYPGWTPRVCLKCKDASGGSKRSNKKKKSPRKKSRTASANLTLAQVLDQCREGPSDGLFTDGSSIPNPGPGGWGAVYVVDGQVVDQAYGHDPDTTNNRMELTALIEALRALPYDAQTTVYSDSQLCVKTVNEWAAGWEQRGWRRKSGPIANLELVKRLYGLARAHPGVRIEWIRAHDGSRWNEYADALASRYLLE